MKKCKDCNKEVKHKGFFCRSCYVAQRKLRVKQKAVAYLGGECQECGYKKSIHCLHFHHLDPELKSFNISGGHCRSWKAIEEELNKCILLCSRCHGEIEYGIVPPAPVA